MKTKISSLALLVLATSLTGCGAKVSKKNNYATFSTPDYSTSLPGDGDPTPFPSTTPSPTPTGTTGIPPYSFLVRGVGYSSTTLTISTRSVLKIRFSPGIQDRSIAAGNYSPQYSAMGVYIQVGNTSAPTEMLSNGLTTGTAQQSAAMDYSNAFTKTCPATDLGCRQNVTITVKQPNYDHFCYTYGLYCPWTHVYETHPWNGTIHVQTDDTDGV